MGSISRPWHRLVLATALVHLLHAIWLQASAGAEVLPTPARLHQEFARCISEYEVGNYRQALPSCQDAVDTLEKHAPDSTDLSTALHSLAAVYEALGAYDKVEPLYVRSLQIAVAQLDRWHPDVAIGLNNLGEYYYRRGQYALAEQHYLRSRDIFEKLPGAKDVRIAQPINNLAVLYKTQSLYAKAEPLYLLSLQIWERARPDSPDVALALNNLGEFYRAQAEYSKAEPLYLRSMQIFEKQPILDKQKMVSVLNNMALLYKARGEYAKAEANYQRSLQLWRQVLASVGDEHPQIALLFNNLATLYSLQGGSAKAEQLYLQSLKIYEKTMGLEHPEVATSLNNLALFYSSQGEYAQAKPLLERALQIRINRLPPDHPLIAMSLGTLAGLYTQTGQLAQAAPLFERSLKMFERQLSPDHPDIAIALHNSAVLYQDMGDSAKAAEYAQRSLQIRIKKLGDQHPDVAASFHSLATMRHKQGDYASAAPLYEKSLRIQELAFGAEHPDVAATLDDMAVLDLDRGLLDQAWPRIIRAQAIRERVLRAAATERRVTALLDEFSGEEDGIYSLLLLPNAPDAARRIALNLSLLRKGRSAEAGLITGWALQDSLKTPDQKQKFQEWLALRVRRETLYLRGPAKYDDNTRLAHRSQLAALQNQIDRMEQDLARQAPLLRKWQPPQPEQMIAAVAGRLPPGSALVEVLWFRPFVYSPTSPEHRSQEARYVALILFPDQRIEFIDLHESQPIDRAVAEFLLAIRNRAQEPLAAAQALYQKVYAPLRPALQNTRQIYLSLDGALHLVPFAALHDGQRYLLDAPTTLRYVGSGRDLLRETLGRAEQPPLVIADPNFAALPVAAVTAAPHRVEPNTQGLYAELKGLDQLEGARREGVIISQLLKTRPLLGDAATELRIRQLRAPQVLHFATHGLFLEDPARTGRGLRSKLIGKLPDDSFYQMTGKLGDRSLSRSALMLAGAAHAEQATDAASDGLLTAEEARSLYLFGTQLVVLSACDTGRGRVLPRQGVYGLRRAFQAAGAETVVMSLWPISDTDTQGLMQRYYRLLKDAHQPRGRISCLEEAMRQQRQKRPHPYYWAPFIALGADDPLRP